MARQGPHHAAQKSTSTGSCEPSTSVWKLSSVNVATSALAIVGSLLSSGCGQSAARPPARQSHCVDLPSLVSVEDPAPVVRCPADGEDAQPDHGRSPLRTA